MPSAGRWTLLRGRLFSDVPALMTACGCGRPRTLKNTLPFLPEMQSAYGTIAERIIQAQTSSATFDIALEAPQGMKTPMREWARALSRTGQNATIHVSVFAHGGMPDFREEGPDMRRMAIFTSDSGRALSHVSDLSSSCSGYLAYTLEGSNDPEPPPRRLRPFRALRRPHPAGVRAMTAGWMPSISRR